MSRGGCSRTLGALERDAVGEMLNVAVGRAAVVLSRMVDCEVLLSAPQVEFLSSPGAVRYLDRVTGPQPAVAVRQTFRSDFSGDILLIFPQDGSLDLVRGVLGERAPLDGLGELEQEALLEVGNIILNACLGSLANQLGIGIESSLPTYLRGRGGNILCTAEGRPELVMVLEITFAVAATGLTGYLAFVMDIGSSGAFADAVAAYVARKVRGG